MASSADAAMPAKVTQTVQYDSNPGGGRSRGNDRLRVRLGTDAHGRGVLMSSTVAEDQACGRNAASMREPAECAEAARTMLQLP